MKVAARRYVDEHFAIATMDLAGRGTALGALVAAMDAPRGTDGDPRSHVGEPALSRLPSRRHPPLGQDQERLHHDLGLENTMC